MLHPFEIALILGAVLLIFELLTGSFVVVCFAPALFVIALVEFMFHGFNLLREFLVFVVVVIGASLMIRMVFKNQEDAKKSTKDINDY